MELAIFYYVMYIKLEELHTLVAPDAYFVRSYLITTVLETKIKILQDSCSVSIFYLIKKILVVHHMYIIS